MLTTELSVVLKTATFSADDGCIKCGLCWKRISHGCLIMSDVGDLQRHSTIVKPADMNSTIIH